MLGALALPVLTTLLKPYPWQPHEKAAMAAILSAVGQKELALKISRSIDPKTPLFPEERRWVIPEP